MKKSLLFVLASTFLLLAGCADKPNSIGDGVPPSYEAFALSETTFTAFSDTAYKVPLVNGFSPNNLVGILPTGEEFITLFQFYATNNIDSLRGARIDTAEIRMTVSYRMLPSAPPLSFGIYEVLNSFSEGSFTSDTLNSIGIGTELAGTFSDSMNYLQTVTASIDTNVARRWADDHLDTTKPAFYGFAIKALSASGVIGFNQFNIFSATAPILVIKYTRGERLDSLFFSLGQDTYAGKFPNASPLSDLEVRGGIGVRSKLKFDISSLISASKESIPNVANATLILTADTLASVFSGYSPDTLVALLALSDAQVDSSSSSFFAYGLRRADPSGNRVYGFIINTIAQRWINNLSANEGLTIRWAAENSTIEKVVFHSISDPDERKRPQLKIIYAEKQQ